MTWTVSGSGTFTPAVIGTEYTLGSADTANASYVVLVDTSNLANAGEVVELRIYSTILAAGTERVVWKGVYKGGDPLPNAQSPFMPSDQSMHVTLRQTSGTARAFPWKVLRA